MKTYSNTLFFAENSEKERIDHFDIRSVFQIKVFIWIDNPIPAPTWSWAFLGGWSLCQVLQTTFETKRLVFDQHKFIKKFTTTQLTEKTLRFNLDYKATTRVESLPSSMRRSELVPNIFLIYTKILFRNLTYGDVCASVQEQSSDGSGPTHIVASITYGMNAIMIFEKVLLKVGCLKSRFLGCIRIRVPRASWGEVVHCSEQHSWLQHQRRGRDQHGWEQQGVLWEHYVQGRSHAGVT